MRSSAGLRAPPIASVHSSFAIAREFLVGNWRARQGTRYPRGLAAHCSIQPRSWSCAWLLVSAAKFVESLGAHFSRAAGTLPAMKDGLGVVNAAEHLAFRVVGCLPWYLAALYATLFGIAGLTVAGFSVGFFSFDMYLSGFRIADDGDCENLRHLDFTPTPTPTLPYS